MRRVQRILADRSRWGGEDGKERPRSGKVLAAQLIKGLKGECPKGDACRLCDARLVGLSRRVRAAFETHVGDVPWTMLVVVPSQWQYDREGLLSCSPSKHLEEFAQRLRRAKVCEAVMGFDLTLNRVIDLSGGETWYWSPHINILVPARSLAVVQRVARRFCNASQSVPRPMHTRGVSDPYVGANYAIKLDLGGVRQRTQTTQAGGQLKLLQWRGRLSEADYRTFLRWRMEFPATDLVKCLGLTLVRETARDRNGATCRAVIDEWAGRPTRQPK